MSDSTNQGPNLLTPMLAHTSYPHTEMRVRPQPDLEGPVSTPLALPAATPVLALPPAPEDARAIAAPGSGGRRRGWWTFLFVALILIGGILIFRSVWTHLASDKAKKAPPKPIPVQVGKVSSKSMPVEVSGVGNMTAFSTVSVTSQVTGELTKVLFTQGEFVHKGQPLFEIDPRTYQASVDQMQANVRRDVALVAQAQKNVARDRATWRQSQATLAKDTSQQVFAQKEEERYRLLVLQGFVTVEQYETEKANAGSYDALLAADRDAVQTAMSTLESDVAAVHSAQATTESDQATVQNAQVQLGFTYIRAPMDGRTGSLNTYAGSVVPGNGGLSLVTLDQITPIYVSFAVPERYLAEIRQRQLQHPLAVSVSLGPKQTEKGSITFIDNTVDTTTGTITLRATFPNKQHRLWPGQFATITLLLHTLPHAVVLPSQAIQPGQDGDYVFVVNKDKTVAMHTVVVQQSLGDQSVISSGVKPGDTVVTDGQSQLKAGVKIQAVTPSGSPSPTPAGGNATPSGPPGMPGSTSNVPPAHALGPSLGTASPAPASGGAPANGAGTGTFNPAMPSSTSTAGTTSNGL